MAVYQGARPRGFELPRPSFDLDRLPLGARRRSTTGLVRDGRPTRVGTVLACIVVAFVLAFLSLSQSVRVAATNYDLVRLGATYQRLDAVRQNLRSDIDRLGSEPAIRQEGLDNGLGQLDAPLIVQAR